MKKLILFFVFTIISKSLFSQVLETTPPDYIRTIEFSGSADELSGTPIVPLGDQITLSFDDLIGDEADYYYTIEHFDFDWTPSDLAKNEYMEGFDNMRILDYNNSYNTLQIYSHYTLTIPNNNTRKLKVSGNYLLSIFNNNKELMFSRKFMVYENIASISAEIRRSRNLKFIDTKQVVYFSISGNDQLVFKNPNQNLKTLIIQNNNLKTSIYNLKPQYSLGNELIYRYDQEAAFWGGNEYLEFDNKDVRAATMNIRSIELKDIYNTYLYTDKNRSYDPYTYDPDINGQFKINTIQGDDETIESEYTWVHFSLANYEKLKDGEIHIYGNFNNFNLDNSTKLTYNYKKDVYELKRLFKQGFYNYKYVLRLPDGSIDEGFNSGNFDETENQYTILAYYRDIGARYDRIIGAGSANSRTISN